MRIDGILPDDQVCPITKDDCLGWKCVAYDKNHYSMKDEVTEEHTCKLFGVLSRKYAGKVI